jgi:hypothetical protein
MHGADFRPPARQVLKAENHLSFQSAPKPRRAHQANRGGEQNSKAGQSREPEAEGAREVRA